MERASGAKIAMTPTTTIRTDLVGVVLCGGFSTRMGRDKGLIHLGETTWAGQAIKILNQFTSRVVLSLRDEQIPAYREIFPEAELVPDTFSDMGPLGGLLSVQEKYPVSDFILLACDMIEVTAGDIAPLLTERTNAAAYSTGDIYEPLCAFYPAAICTKISAQTDGALAKNERPSSLQLLLKTFNTRTLSPAAPGRLKSFNTGAA